MPSGSKIASDLFEDGFEISEVTNFKNKMATGTVTVCM
jgi:hypothetical protein